MTDPGQEREALEQAFLKADGGSWIEEFTAGWNAGRKYEAALAAREEPQGDGMVHVFIDGEGYRVRPDVEGEFLLSLRPHRPLEDWVVWQEVHPEDTDAGWDRPLNLVGGERFYTAPKYITASAREEPLADDALCECGHIAHWHAAVTFERKTGRGARKVSQGLGVCEFDDDCNCEEFRVGLFSETVICCDHGKIATAHCEMSGDGLVTLGELIESYSNPPVAREDTERPTNALLEKYPKAHSVDPRKRTLRDTERPDDGVALIGAERERQVSNAALAAREEPNDEVERMDFDDHQALPSPTGHRWRQRLVGKWHDVKEER